MSNPAGNVNEVVAWLGRFVDSFDFTRVGTDQSLGRDVVNEIVQGIQHRSVDDRRGADVTWPDLSDTPHPPWPGYRTRKRQLYGIDNEPNTRTGQMLSETSLRGRPEYSPKEIRIVYGTGRPPTSSAAPNGYLSDADRKVTDVEKAGYATDKGRPFFELDPQIEADVIEVIGDNLNDYILSAG